MNESELGIEKESIPFYKSQDTKNIKTMEIKFTLSGSSFKTQLPIFREGNVEDLLHFLYEFNQSKSKLGYTTHQKLESGLEQLLQGNARNEWNTIQTTISPNVNTIAAFSQRVTAFKRLYIPEPSAIDNQRNYLMRIKKNDKLSVPQFLDRLKHINSTGNPNGCPSQKDPRRQQEGSTKGESFTRQVSSLPTQSNLQVQQEQ